LEVVHFLITKTSQASYLATSDNRYYRNIPSITLVLSCVVNLLPGRLAFGTKLINIAATRLLLCDVTPTMLSLQHLFYRPFPVNYFIRKPEKSAPLLALISLLFVLVYRPLGSYPGA